MPRHVSREAAERKAQRDAEYDAKRQNAARRGYDREWSAFRAEVLRERGHACSVCGATKGTMYLDHRHELRDGGARLSKDNVDVLCASHHSLKTAAVRARRRRFDK